MEAIEDSPSPALGDRKEGGKQSSAEGVGTNKTGKLTVASVYETQSEGELLTLYGQSQDENADNEKKTATKAAEIQTADTPSTAVKTGRIKRKERRLRNEPQNISGREEGPTGIHVLDFAEARAAELCSMVKAMASKQHSKRTFQQLPRHMRRRAMSHNVKRLPRALRAAATREMEKTKKPTDGAAKNRNGSRKQRRNTTNLKSVYAQRGRQNKWLETHIWHAKRMKMCDKYGYKIADHCADKGIRAAYLSLTHGCLISDISYYCCVEVTGVQSQVLTSLSGMFSSETGLTIGSKAYLRGLREGKAVAYRRGQYPHGAIGPVQFLWQCQPPQPAGTSQSNAERNCAIIAKSEPTSFWVWCHPAMYEDVLSEITASVASFNAKCVTGLAKSGENPIVNALYTSTSSQASEENSKRVSIKDLKSELVRFRLIGPRSHALLMESLKPIFDFRSAEDEYVSKTTESETDSMEIDPPSVPDVPRWWHCGSQTDLYIERHSEILSESFVSLKSATNPAQFIKGTVIGLTVHDPRLTTPAKKLDLVSEYYPSKKNKCSHPLNDGRNQQDMSGDEVDSNDATSSRLLEESCSGGEMAVQINSDGQFSSLQQPPVEISYSPLWNPCIRVLVSNSKPSTQTVDTIRSGQFLRSSQTDLGNKSAKIPVLVIQQTLSTNSNTRQKFPTAPQTGYGWDVVLPANWGREFWVSFIYHGARACGMKELKKCSLEILGAQFPEDYPDTPAGEKHQEERRVSLEEQYRRYPPDKRRNYGKLLISSPFYLPWSQIVATWRQDTRINQICSPQQSVKRIKLKVDHQEKDANLSLCEYQVEKSRDCKRPLDGGSMHTPPQSLFSHFTSSSVYVLRSKEILCSLGEFIDYLFTGKLQRKMPTTASAQSFHSAVNEFSIDVHLREHASALVAVRVQMYQRGTLKDRDSISLPIVSDFDPLLSASSSWPYSGPKELQHSKGITVDGGNSLVIGMSSLARKDIKAVKAERKRKNVKSNGPNGAGNSTNDFAVVPSCDDPETSNTSIIKDFKLRPVFPSRETFGFVTSAGYRLTSSLYSGVGFCTFGGFLEAVSRSYVTAGVKEPLALVRSESTQYWFVRLSLL